MLVTVVAVMAATVAAIVLIAARRVSLTVIVLHVHMVTLRLALTRTHAQRRIHAPKRRHALTSHPARTLVVQSNPRARPTVATTAVTTMIAHHVQVVTLATAVAILVAVKTAVQRSLIVAVRIRALAPHALKRTHAPKRRHAPTKAVKSVAHSVVIARTLVLLLVMADRKSVV